MSHPVVNNTHNTTGFHPDVLLFIVEILEKKCDVGELISLKKILETSPYTISVSRSRLTLDNPIAQCGDRQNLQWFIRELNAGLCRHLLRVPVKSLNELMDAWCKKWGLEDVFLKISIEPLHDNFLESVVLKYLTRKSIGALNSLSREKFSRLYVLRATPQNLQPASALNGSHYVVTGNRKN